MEVSILGTRYKIEYQKDDSNMVGECDGYVDPSIKLIVVKDIEKEFNSVEDIETYKKQVLRHEIIHAFLFESGLWANTHSESWATNEEMVDWIALQLPKIHRACVESGCM